MPPIINAQQVSKAFGANPLFQNVSFTVSEGDRIGLIGPNGSGKSTLLRMLARGVDTDEGNIAFRKKIRVSYVEQDSKFNAEDSVRSVVENALKQTELAGTERDARFAETLGRAGFTEFRNAEVENLNAKTTETIWFEPDIVGLEIAVDDSLLMCFVNR